MKTHLKSLAAGAALASAFALGTITAPPQAEAADSTITFAYAGDSLTSGASSWLDQWDDPSIVSVGGYARSGYTTAQVASAIQPVPDADVLVIMLGTNDVMLGASKAQVQASMDKLVKKVAAPRVLLTFIPPSDVTSSGGINRRLEGYVMNRYLMHLAYHRGWMVYDPWSAYRASTNGWIAGSSKDKVHPVPAVSEGVAERLEEYLRQAVEGARS